MTDDPYAAKPWLTNYDENYPHHIDYPEINLYEILDKSAEEFGNRTAIWFQKKKISYKEFKEISDRLATALVELGVKKGDRVFLFQLYTRSTMLPYPAIQNHCFASNKPPHCLLTIQHCRPNVEFLSHHSM